MWSCNSSVSAVGPCSCILCLSGLVFTRLWQVVEPKRIALRAAEDDLRVMMEELAEKQAALKKVLDKIAELEANFKAANEEKESLANQVSTSLMYLFLRVQDHTA